MVDLEDFKPGIYNDVEEVFNDLHAYLCGVNGVTIQKKEEWFVRPFITPKIDEVTGKFKCVFDVKFKDKTYEFVLMHTGGN